MGCGGSRADAIEPRYYESWTRETESTWLTNTDSESPPQEGGSAEAGGREPGAPHPGEWGPAAVGTAGAGRRGREETVTHTYICSVYGCVYPPIYPRYLLFERIFLPVPRNADAKVCA